MRLKKTGPAFGSRHQGQDGAGMKEEEKSLRRFLARSEAATLIGMVMVVFSLFLTWDRQEVAASKILPVPGIQIRPIVLTRSGFGTSAWLPLTICAIACGALLLFPPTGRHRLALAVVNLALGIACVVIAISRLAPQPGVIVALIGAALLTLGATDRFTAAQNAS